MCSLQTPNCQRVERSGVVTMCGGEWQDTRSGFEMCHGMFFQSKKIALQL